MRRCFAGAAALLSFFGCASQARVGLADSSQWATNVKRCGTNLFGVRAAGVIQNTTTKQHDYRLVVDFRSPAGIRVAQATTGVRAVAAGDSAAWEVTGTEDGPDGMTCSVTRIQQF